MAKDSGTPKALVHPGDRIQKSKGKAYAVAVSAAAAYDPEAEFKEPVVSAYEMMKRSAVESKAVEKGDVSIRGRFAVVRAYKDGKMAEATQGANGKWTPGFRPTKESDRHVEAKGLVYHLDFERIETLEQFRKMVATPKWATAKLLETFGGDAFDFGFDDTVGGAGSVVGPPNNEYIPLMGGPFSKQLYLYDYLDMHAKSFWAKNHHPFAKAIVNTLRAYIVGKGVKVMFKDPKRQDAWDAFEKRSDFQEKLRTDTETLIWAGEVMTEKVVDEGGPNIRQIDPSTVWEIVTDPLTPEKALYFHQQFPTQWQLTYKASDKSSEYVINDIDGDKMIHVKINATPGEKRGRSDLFAVLSWLKRYRDFFNAKVVKAQMEESWALDISVDGSQADVDQIAQSNNVTRVPPAGSVRVHNKDVEYEFLQPTSSSTQGRDNVGEQLKNVIAVGAGVAPEWLGESAGGATRATAMVKEDPASRNVEDKQMVIERYVRKVAEFVMENTDVAEGSDKTFEVIFPESATQDRTTKIADIMKAEAARYISHERAAGMVAKELAITSYDVAKETRDIDSERDAGGGNPEWAGAAKPPANGNGNGKPPEGKAAAAAYQVKAEKR